MIYIDDDILRWSTEELEAAIAQLPPQRREVCQRYKFELGRRQALFSYLLLCKGLREEYGIDEAPDFTFGEHGKPALLQHPEIHFNISHCQVAVACAISDNPVGIDVESIRPLHESVVRYSMSDEEINQVHSAVHPEREFIRLWTRKEALLKCTGEGINDDMKGVLNNLYGLHLETIERENYIYSVCKKKTLNS